MSSATEIEAVLFKPAGDRYVFQAPNRWVFGRKDRYLVTDAQKQELLAIVAPPRPALRVAIIVAVVLAWTLAVSGFMWMVSPHDEPTAADVLVMAVLIIGPLFLALVMMLQRNLRRMQPILAGAPRTDERITPQELRAAMTGALSPRRATLYGSLWTLVLMFQGLNLYLRSGKLPLLSDVQSYLAMFTAVIAAGLMVHYFRIAARKFSAGTEAAP